MRLGELQPGEVAVTAADAVYGGTMRPQRLAAGARVRVTYAAAESPVWVRAWSEDRRTWGDVLILDPETECKPEAPSGAVAVMGDAYGATEVDPLLRAAADRQQEQGNLQGEIDAGNAELLRATDPPGDAGQAGQASEPPRGEGAAPTAASQGSRSPRGRADRDASKRTPNAAGKAAKDSPRRGRARAPSR